MITFWCWCTEISISCKFHIFSNSAQVLSNFICFIFRLTECYLVGKQVNLNNIFFKRSGNSGVYTVTCNFFAFVSEYWSADCDNLTCLGSMIWKIIPASGSNSALKDICNNARDSPDKCIKYLTLCKELFCLSFCVLLVSICIISGTQWAKANPWFSVQASAFFYFLF